MTLSTRNILRQFRCRFASITLSLLVCLTPVHARDSATPKKPRPLPAPVETLARSFRTGDPGVLRTLLQGGGKIRAFSPALGLKSGYYSPDQLYFLFQDLFRVHKTTKFHILRGAEFPPNSARQTVLARWSYQDGHSQDFSADISFDLVRRDGLWCIQEILEIL